MIASPSSQFPHPPPLPDPGIWNEANAEAATVVGVLGPVVGPPWSRVEGKDLVNFQEILPDSSIILRGFHFWEAPFSQMLSPGWIRVESVTGWGFPRTRHPDGAWLQTQGWRAQCNSVTDAGLIWAVLLGY